MSEFDHPSLRGRETTKDTRINRRRRIFLACFASILPLAPLAFPSPSDIRIASDPCLSPIKDSRSFTTGRAWIDKQSCKYMGLACSSTSRLQRPLVPDEGDDESRLPDACKDLKKPQNYSDFWHSGWSRPELWNDEERRLRTIPQYVLDYAPMIHLYSGEQFWPCDVASHLQHTTPFLNFTPIEEEGREDRHYGMAELGRLGRYGRDVYLTSDDNVEDRPDWLGGEINIPDEDDDIFKRHRQFLGGDDIWDMPKPEGDGIPGDESNDDLADMLEEEADRIAAELKKRGMSGKPMTAQQGGKSDAPVILISVDKGNGIVDAFWFFFYSYNLGNKVFNVRFGNHVADWEHTVVRFDHGEPIEVFFSEHYFGQAYSYGAVEKIGKRPLGFSATGTHAMYATAGVHRYILPWGLLHDMTDRGPLWDPVLNTQSYTWEPRTNIIRSSTLNPYSPVGWLNFFGHWGDKAYPKEDPRQYRFAGQYHYVSGPPGPKYHGLNREHICQGRGECKINHWIPPPGTTSKFLKHGLAEEGEKRNILDEIQIIMASRW